MMDINKYFLIGVMATLLVFIVGDILLLDRVSSKKRIMPVIRIDIKDNKIDTTYTYYETREK